MKINKILLMVLFILSPLVADNNQTAVNKYSEQDWGIGAVYRAETLQYIIEERGQSF